MTVTALGRSRDLVAPALRDAVQRLDASTRLVVSYHLGWCDEHGHPIEATGGKAVRPALALLSASAVGERTETGLPGAVAVELVHNFSLLHDDLMDRDHERRHRRTVWSLWGDATAVLAGDALLSLAHEVLLDSGTPHAGAAGQVLATATRELIRGQAQDLAFEQRDDVGLAECLDMAAGKTGALLSASAAIGAVLAGGAPAVVDALSAYGSQAGMAFQLVDDLLGIWGTPGATGKPVYSDLYARKKTLPVTWAIEHGGEHGHELARWMSESDPPSERSVRHAAQLVEAAGGRAWAADEAARRAAIAEASLDGATIAAGPRHELGGLARFIVARHT